MESLNEAPIYLYDVKLQRPIPLQKITIGVVVLFSQAKLIITQDYENFSDDRIETVFYFPVDADTSFSRLTAKFGNEELVTEVDERKKVDKVFKDALDEGKTAISGDYATSKTQDVLRIRLGGFPPKTKATLTLELHQTLRVEDLSYELRIPLTCVPRYIGKQNIDEFLSRSLDLEDLFPEFSQIEGPSDYLWDIKVQVRTSGKIQRIQSKNHEVICEHEDNKATVRLKNVQDRNFIPLQDFVLLIADDKIGTPSLITASHKGDQGFIISYFPDFRTEEMKAKIKETIDKNGINWQANAAMAPDLSKIQLPSGQEFNIDKCEYIFFIDRSGSMDGASITLAKECLKLFLYSLPPESKFNVVSFGSNYKLLFNKIESYNDITLKQAVDKVGTFTANLGGTEIFTPMKYILEQPITSGYNRQIFLLTDGAVWDVDKLVELITSKRSQNLRINTFGIGNACSSDLVRNVATYGGGMFYFVDNPNEIEKKVIDSLCLTILPYVQLENIQIIGEDGSTLYNNRQIQTVANGALFQIKGFLPQSVTKIKHAEFKIFDPTTSQRKTEKIEKNELTVFNQVVLKVCVAQVLKNRFQNPYNDEQLTKISIKHQVIGPGTSFFACKQIFDLNTNQCELVPIQHTVSKYVQIIISSPSGKNISLIIDRIATIHDLKLAIQEKEDIPPEQLRLMFNGKDLEDCRIVDDYKIKDAQVIGCVQRLRGGGCSLKIVDVLGSVLFQKPVDSAKQTLRDIWNQINGNGKKPINNFKFLLVENKSSEQIQEVLVDWDCPIIAIKMQEDYKFVLIEFIRVQLRQKGQKGEVQTLKYHESYCIYKILETCGLTDWLTDVKINGKQFTGSKRATFQQLGITSNDLIEFESSNFKSVIYLQFAEGYWSSSLLDLIGSSDQEFLGKQSQQIRKLQKEQLYTFLGLKLLYSWFKAEQSQWRMIERKAFNYLKQQLKIDHANIEKMMQEMKL